MSRVDPPGRTLVAVSALGVVVFLSIGAASILCRYDLNMYEGEGCIPLASTGIAAGQPIYGRRMALKEPFLFATFGRGWA